MTLSIWVLGIIVASPVYVKSKYTESSGNNTSASYGWCGTQWDEEMEKVGCSAANTDVFNTTSETGYGTIVTNFTIGYECTCGLQQGRVTVMYIYR